MRQGDGLSSVIFNLAAEPLVRRAKAHSNGGFNLFNTCLKATAYADDIVVVGSNYSGLQHTISGLNMTANTLGLRFNAGKCSSLIISAGRACSSAKIVIDDVPVRYALGKESIRLTLVSLWAPG